MTASSVGAWALQLSLNLCWSLVFFGARLIGAALVEIAVLFAAILVTITLYATLPNAIAARIDLPADSVQELVAYAKANPGRATYASQGSGTTSRGTTWNRAAEMPASMADLALVALPDTRQGTVLVA